VAVAVAVAGGPVPVPVPAPGAHGTRDFTRNAREITTPLHLQARPAPPPTTHHAAAARWQHLLGHVQQRARL